MILRVLIETNSFSYFAEKNILKVTHLAQALRSAADSKIPIPPLRNDIGVTDVDLAYSIQKINTLNRVKSGSRIIGRKIGLTSKAVQQQLGVDQPDYGFLFDDMEVLNGLSVKMSDLMQPKAEVEIAFILGEDLDSENMTLIDLLAAIDYALPAIEIVGSRIENWDIKITDTIADNASASHYVLGHTPKTLDEIDLVNCKMSMHKNGTVVSTGKGSSCLGSPLNATLWLAKRAVELDEPLQAGELILTGALGAMAALAQGDHIEADIDGLGSVSFYVE